MAVTTMEGRCQEKLRYHYDVRCDVLYLRLLAYDDHEIWGEEDENGTVVLHSEQTDQIVGMTIDGFWRRFGSASPASQAPPAMLEATIASTVSGIGDLVPAA